MKYDSHNTTDAVVVVFTFVLLLGIALLKPVSTTPGSIMASMGRSPSRTEMRKSKQAKTPSAQEASSNTVRAGGLFPTP